MTPAGLYRNQNAAYRPDEETVSDPYRLQAGKVTNGRTTGMTMVNIDTSFFDLPVVLEAGHLAALCYLAAYLWTEKHGTRGVIPAGAVNALVAWAEFGQGTQAADRCVQVGLMERAGGGYRLLDYRKP